MYSPSLRCLPAHTHAGLAWGEVALLGLLQGGLAGSYPRALAILLLQGSSRAGQGESAGARCALEERKLATEEGELATKER